MIGFITLIVSALVLSACSVTDGDQAGTTTEYPNTIAGTVIDSLEGPVDNARVYMVEQNGWSDKVAAKKSPVITSTTTDKSGSFTFERYENSAVSIEVVYDSLIQQVYDVQGDQDSIMLDTLTLVSTKWFKGVVIDSAYFNSKLFIEPTRHSVVVDGRGTFLFRGLLEHDYRFYIRDTVAGTVISISDSMVNITETTTPFEGFKLKDVPDVTVRKIDSVPSSGTDEDTTDVIDTTASQDSTVQGGTLGGDTTSTSIDSVLSFDDFNDGNWKGSVGDNPFSWYFRIASHTWLKYNDAQSMMGDTFDNRFKINAYSGDDGFGLKIKNYYDTGDSIKTWDRSGVMAVFDDRSINISQYSKIRFSIKGTGALNINMFIHKLNTPDVYENFFLSSEPIQAEGDWKEVTLNLNDFWYINFDAETDGPKQGIKKLLKRVRLVGFTIEGQKLIRIDSIEFIR
ncbi:MAG: carboxypeptidase-like regulatory domain-containing protein [Fibrobacterales bacterium]